MDDPYDLERFVEAQNAGGIFEVAVQELHSGKKLTHWMWFVFPQLAGLGHSATSRKFAITSLDEARAYLVHPTLGARLLECTATVAASNAEMANQIFGGIDSNKFHSSLTLFSRAGPEISLFREVLERFFGGLEDQATIDRL